MKAQGRTAVARGIRRHAEVGTTGACRCAQNDCIETDSQFDLAVKAAHKFALAGLRREGYRSEDRITVCRTLTHTVGMSAADLQIFLKAHSERNLASYQGRIDID